MEKIRPLLNGKLSSFCAYESVSWLYFYFMNTFLQFQVKQGTGSIAGLREDRRNVAKAVYPLHYGAFSSHGPTYDSTFANLTKEETEMVHNTYGDEVGVQYAESILNFSRNCDYAMGIVDHLLDILTGNEHRKTSK